MLASPSAPTLHEHGRALCVRRRLRWLTAVLAVVNLALWSVVFGLPGAT